MDTTYTAFDYVTQTWVSGDEARKLRIHQVTDTIELLNGPRGIEYAKFIRVEHASHLRALETELTQLLR